MSSINFVYIKLNIALLILICFNRNIDYINGRGYFVDPNTIAATLKNGSEKILKADHIVVACGGRPSYPDVPGAKELSITSDDLFSLLTPPGDTLIIGAGCILCFMLKIP